MYTSCIINHEKDNSRIKNLKNNSSELHCEDFVHNDLDKSITESLRVNGKDCLGIRFILELFSNKYGKIQQIRVKNIQKVSLWVDTIKLKRILESKNYECLVEQSISDMDFRPDTIKFTLIHYYKKNFLP